MNKSHLVVKLSSFFVVLAILVVSSCGTKKKLVDANTKSANNRYVNLSTQLMHEVMRGNNGEEIRAQLEGVDPDTLANYLITDNQKKAFWINVYNAHIQIKLRANPEYFENRGKFFGSPSFVIAKRKLSFDDVEHGIIRSSKIKLSLGLLSNPFAGKYEKQFRTKQADGRVHFALNCGAKSCPLVAAYDAANFDQKIDEVAKNFLKKMSNYNGKENTVTTTTLFSWFRGDFKGKKGVKKMLKTYDIIPKDSDPTIVYDKYDWTLSLGNYYDK